MNDYDKGKMLTHNIYSSFQIPKYLSMGHGLLGYVMLG